MISVISHFLHESVLKFINLSPCIFYSFLNRDASTSLVISRLGSLGVYFYCCVINVSFVKFTDFFNFMIYEFDE